MFLVFVFSIQNSIVHRDLKLENILLDASNQPKVNNDIFCYSCMIAVDLDNGLDCMAVDTVDVYPCMYHMQS